MQVLLNAKMISQRWVEEKNENVKNIYLVLNLQYLEGAKTKTKKGEGIKTQGKFFIFFLARWATNYSKS